MKYSKYIIDDDRIIFDYYEFCFSSLKKNKILTLDRINEVDLSTCPCSMEIDKGEIIFFNQGDETRIKAFSRKHKIKESEKVDTWELICNEFLDTEFDEAQIDKDQQILEQLGFSFEELKNIKRRIKWTLYGTTDWNYIGHWDLLAMKQHRNFLYLLRVKNIIGGPWKLL